MKKALFTLVCIAMVSLCKAQSITYEDFKSLIPFLQKEDWQSAYNASSKLLEENEVDNDDPRAIVLYINILSGAGLVAQGKLTYEQLEAKILPYQGQHILMASHPLSIKGEDTMNKTFFSETDSTFEAFTTSTNKGGTNILCFEKFYFDEKVLTNQYKNSMVRCGGKLEKIEFNPNKSTIWILRLTIKDAYHRKAN